MVARSASLRNGNSTPVFLNKTQLRNRRRALSGKEEVSQGGGNRRLLPPCAPAPRRRTFPPGQDESLTQFASPAQPVQKKTAPFSECCSELSMLTHS